jgi:hypothetical protein
MPLLFRAMKENARGMPQLGAGARILGVRPGIDIPATLPTERVQPGQGGLSVSPNDPMNLPVYRRPVAFQGTGKDPVWMINEADLGADLVYRSAPHNAGHGFIEPAKPMTVHEYQTAVQQTQPLWRKVTSGPMSGSSSDGA